MTPHVPVFPAIAPLPKHSNAVAKGPSARLGNPENRMTHRRYTSLAGTTPIGSIWDNLGYHGVFMGVNGITGPWRHG